MPPETAPARRYDWSAIQRAYDSGMSVRDCMREFGFSTTAWNDARERGDVVARPHPAPIEKFLVRGRKTSRNHLKLRLFAEGLKEARCEECGLTEWRGQRLALELHHRNGVKNDNRLPNLSILCPNCHSLTHSWGGRNARRRLAVDELVA